MRPAHEVEMIEWEWDIYFDFMNILDLPISEGICPKCGKHSTFSADSNKTILRRCHNHSCKKTFSPLTNTIFAKTHLPLTVWIKAIYILKIHNPKISIAGLSRELSVTPNSASKVKRKISTITKDSPEYKLMEMHMHHYAANWENFTQSQNYRAN